LMRHFTLFQELFSGSTVSNKNANINSYAR